MNIETKQKHVGRNISRIRELRGMKQEALAIALGITQQTVSNMENSESVEDGKLEEVANVLGVTKEAIKNFSEEAVLNIIGNTYNLDNSSAVNYGCTINPFDKLVEVFEENKSLYERLLAAEKEKNSYLEKMLGK